MGYYSLAAILVLGSAALSNAKSPGFYFGGPFMGNCGPDGYYYGGPTNFVQCIGGKPYTMQCAPGTENSPLKQYKQGYYVSVTIFCDVNLNDAQNVPPPQKMMMKKIDDGGLVAPEEGMMKKIDDGGLVAPEDDMMEKTDDRGVMVPEGDGMMKKIDDGGLVAPVAAETPEEETVISEADSSEESSEEESAEESSEDAAETMPKPDELSIAPPNKKSGYFYHPYFAGYPYKSLYPYPVPAYPYDNPYYARYL